MESNKIKQLHEFGQSIWLDFLDRRLINSGQLRKLIEQDGLRGMTSNPAIFEKSISSSTAYDDQIMDLAATLYDLKVTVSNVIHKDSTTAKTNGQIPDPSIKRSQWNNNLNILIARLLIVCQTLADIFMKSIWKGAIGFGLVNIPVKLFSAVQNSSLDFDMLDERDHARIKYQRVNEHTGKEVPYEKIVKGYQLNEKYVVLDEHDFEEASPEKTKIIELENFVDIQQINPIYYETSYYSQPENQGKKAYSLLLSALTKSKKVGLARFVFRNTENLCVIHPMDEVLVITKIRFAEEIRSTKEVKLKGETSISSKELQIGMALIDQYSGNFDISAFKDEHRVELLSIIKAKAKGKRPIIKKMQPKKASSDDLYSQLMESLTKKKGA